MRYSLVETSQPDAEPVSLDEAKAQLRVTSADEDLYIERLIKTAREYCETFTRRALAQRSFRMKLDEFPCDRDNIVQIPRPPLVSISAIEYVDAGGNDAELTSSDFVLDTDSEPGVITAPYGESWPSTRDQRGAVSITFTAGYLPDVCPERVKQAMLLLIGHWYNNREDILTGTISKEIENASTALLWQLKFDL